MPDIQIPDYFTRHSASPNPAPGKRVIVAYADGKLSIPSASETFSSLVSGKDYWQHEAGGKYNIIAFRVVD